MIEFKKGKLYKYKIFSAGSANLSSSYILNKFCLWNNLKFSVLPYTRWHSIVYDYFDNNDLIFILNSNIINSDFNKNKLEKTLQFIKVMVKGRIGYVIVRNFAYEIEFEEIIENENI